MRLALLLVPLALLASPAWTASNTVDPAGVGSGAGAVSGYAVSSVAYALEGATVADVSFALSPPGATTVRARLAPDAPWTSCTVAAGGASCPVGTPVASATSLEVVATG
jgi:hypothetical protein